MIKRFGIILACGWTMACPVPVEAQPHAPPPQPLDQAVEDVNALSTSLRQTEAGLRQPAGFTQVYEVPGHPDLLMRVSGGVYAVFPRSEYARGKRGPIAVIPANTIFYIGAPPVLLVAKPIQTEQIIEGVRQSTISPTAQQARRRRGEILGNSPGDEVVARKDAAQSAEVPPPSHQPRPVEPTDLPTDDPERIQAPIGESDVPMTIANDPTYRIYRLEQLLRRAAETDLHGAG